MRDNESLNEFLALVKHNEQVRNNLKEFIRYPERFPHINGSSVNFEYRDVNWKPNLTLNKIEQVIRNS
jgi:hypothetical protein